MKNTYLHNFWYRSLFFILLLSIFSFDCQKTPYPLIENPIKGDFRKASPPEHIFLNKRITFRKYQLRDAYVYEKEIRQVPWSQLRKGLSLIEEINKNSARWGVLQNYKNRNGYSPRAIKAVIDSIRSQDRLGNNRNQAIPLYAQIKDKRPQYYGLDGAIIAIKNKTKTHTLIYSKTLKDSFYTPSKFVKAFADSCIIKQAIFINRKQQTQVSLERASSRHWDVISLTPCSTGIDSLPYYFPTPLGAFAIQEKKYKMFYLINGTKDEIAGFCPYASRFSGGAHIHGMATVYPNEKIVEYSKTLGTSPRSHMCVRNATSHAKFIYKWAKTMQSVVFVIE